jgi:hypothetical protein
MSVSPMINTHQTYQGNKSTDGSGCIRLPPFPDFIKDFLSYRITPLQKKPGIATSNAGLFKSCSTSSSPLKRRLNSKHQWFVFKTLSLPP